MAINQRVYNTSFFQMVSVSFSLTMKATFFLFAVGFRSDENNAIFCFECAWDSIALYKLSCHNLVHTHFSEVLGWYKDGSFLGSNELTSAWSVSADSFLILSRSFLLAS